MRIQCPYCDSDYGKFLCNEDDHAICNGELLVAACEDCKEEFGVTFGISERPSGF